MSFDDDECSASQSRPIDLYTIATPTATYRLTSHVVDVTYGGATYTALTMSRGDMLVSQEANEQEFTVYLPITHALVQRFAASGIPERQVVVTIVRLQEKSGEAQSQVSGLAQSVSIDGNVAMIRVPLVTGDAMRVRLPVIVASRICQHVLYDIGCSPNPGLDGPHRATFQVPTSVLSVSSTGTTIVVGTMFGNVDQWAQYGEIVHASSGERRQILSHVGTTLIINVPFVGISVGDGVDVFAGCDHGVLSACRNKFFNVRNFGGYPTVSTAVNPWTTGGLGVIVQP